MNVLVLGGTRFVGRHIVLALLGAGHTVSVLTRGQTADELPATVERLHGNRNDGVRGLAALGNRSWEACVDVSGYTPQQVRASAELLQGHVQRYLFISTASVYAEQHRHPIREEDPLVPAAAEHITEVTGETYGPLKVTCETIVQEIYGDACAILRPQLVAGPFDPTARYSYWPDRVARGGTVLAAGRDTDYLQVIDARDIGRFVVTVLEQKLSGVFNLAGPRLTWAAFLSILDARNVYWTNADELERVGTHFSELPIYIPEQSEQGGLMDVSQAKAVAAGLTLTDPADTARDTRAWSQHATLAYPLDPAREAEIIGWLEAN